MLTAQGTSFLFLGSPEREKINRRSSPSHKSAVIRKTASAAGRLPAASQLLQAQICDDRGGGESSWHFFWGQQLSRCSLSSPRRLEVLSASVLCVGLCFDPQEQLLALPGSGVLLAGCMACSVYKCWNAHTASRPLSLHSPDREQLLPWRFQALWGSRPSRPLLLEL